MPLFSQRLEIPAPAKASWVRSPSEDHYEAKADRLTNIVDPDIARNCTTISPCQQDATIIRDNEITQNIVNACGRTEINGNIDIGEQTENELAAGRMTTVSSGSMMQVTIHQVRIHLISL
jgi:hypothetical protein